MKTKEKTYGLSVFICVHLWLKFFLTAFLEIRYIEWLWEQLFQVVRFGFAARVHQHDLDIAAELPQNLTARAAGRRQAISIGRHGHTAELADALGNGFEHGHALGAHGEPVGGILHVAARMHAAFG